MVHSLIISSLHCSHTEDVSTDMLQCLEHSVRTHKDDSSGTALHLVCGVCVVCVCVWPLVACVLCDLCDSVSVFLVRELAQVLS